MSYTQAENTPDDSSVAPENPEETVFAAAFPSAVLADLPCLKETV
jgi:hypothetical protein